MAQEQFDTELKWQLIEPRKLNLVGTKVCIIYVGGGFPYHIHREDACHGAAPTLEDAKEAVKAVVNELMEMGVDP